MKQISFPYCYDNCDYCEQCDSPFSSSSGEKIFTFKCQKGIKDSTIRTKDIIGHIIEKDCKCEFIILDRFEMPENCPYVLEHLLYLDSIKCQT